MFSIFVSRLSSDSHLLSVWFELGTEARQSSPLQCSGFQFSCFCPDRGLLLVLVLGLIPGPVGPSVGRGQMRVSWCQRLDGRMLSTFSMIKFRGANSVLRNYKERQIQSHKQNVNRAASIFSLKHTTLQPRCILAAMWPQELTASNSTRWNKTVSETRSSVSSHHFKHFFCYLIKAILHRCCIPHRAVVCRWSQVHTI